jgi:hypothetical protein
VDEYQALPHGLAILKTGDFRLATTVQPLSQVLPALPLLATEARFDQAEFAEAKSTWKVGWQFMHANRGSYHDYFLAGRAVSVLVLLLTSVLAWGFSRSLYGPAGGLLTAVVVGLCPDLLAHGPLVTPDIYLAAAVVGSLWALDLLLRRPGWAAGGLLGAALGAAGLAKHTGVLLFVLYPLILGGLHLAGRIWPPAELPDRRWRRAWAATGLALLVGLTLINLGYLCQGTFTRLGDYQFKTAGFRHVQGVLPGWLPVPLPYPFFSGADDQLNETGYDAYLMGEFNDSGFYSYYLVALLVKTPVPLFVLCGLATVCAPRVRRREIPLVIAALFFLAFFSLTRHKNIGVRYVLFLYPLAGIWVGRLAASAAWQSARLRRLLAAAGGAALACLLAIAVVVWPDHLTYFNWASGGPPNGHRYLLDSNLDWGQDLITLRDYMDRERIWSVDLAYFGRVAPSVYGVHFRHLGAQADAQRYVVISANLLWGRMYFINGTSFWPPDRDTFRAFRTLRPKIVLGNTLYVYDLNDVREGG